MRRVLVTLAAALAFAGAATADPLLGERALGPAAQRALAAEVRAEQARHPEVFQRVRALRGLDPARYTGTRARRPTVSRELRGLGPDALLPMLDLLVLTEYPRALRDDERAALEVGLLEAVGALRDRRAEPALRAAFLRVTAPDALRAAALGLGALCGDGEVALLASHAREGGARGLAALEGLGSCRRAEAVAPVIAALDAARDEATVTAAARALGSAGSTWAQAATGATTDLPARSAEALVRAFVRARGTARDELRVAILTVGHRATPALLREAARGADADTRAALASLEAAARRALAAE